MLLENNSLIDILDTELTAVYGFLDMTTSTTSTNFLYELFDTTNNTYLNMFSIFSTAEFFSALFIFNFLQLLILTAISELVWPTHLFNRQNTIGFTAYRLRTFTETASKLYVYTRLYQIYNILLKRHN